MPDKHEPREPDSPDAGSRQGLSRRDLLRTTAGAMAAAAGAGLAGVNLAGQVTGTTPDGSNGPLRLPACALDYLDRKKYVHNMEVIAQLPASPGGLNYDGVTCPLWVKGAQRVIPTAGLDITDPKKPVIAMKPTPGGMLNYMTQQKKWVVLSNHAFNGATYLRPGNPRGKYDGDYLAQVKANYKEIRGFRMWDVTDPTSAKMMSENSMGKLGAGSHASFWDGGKYAYLSGAWDEFHMESGENPWSWAVMVYDVSSPAEPKEVSRWWVPGMMNDEMEEYKKKWPFAGDMVSWNSNHGGVVVPRRVENGGTIGYCGMGQFGLYVMDVSNPAKLQVISRAQHQLEAFGGIPHHSIYPIENTAAHPRLANKIISVFEAIEPDSREPWHTSHIIDVKDPKNPKFVGLFPRPMPDKDAPYADFSCARGRFGSHNIQAWAAPGVNNPTFVAMSYFNAGLRIFDISNPGDPKEVAYFVPERDGKIEEFNTWRRQDVSFFIEWDRNLIWMKSNTGIYCLSTPSLGKPILEPRKVLRWTVPHINAGWDEQVPKTVYFGRGLGQLA